MTERASLGEIAAEAVDAAFGDYAARWKERTVEMRGALEKAGAEMAALAKKAVESTVSHGANLPENPQKSADFPWDKRRSSVLAALSSGTHFALSLAEETPREMADRCIVSASTIRDMCSKRSVPNAHSLLLIGEQYPQVLDAWLALIGKKAVDL